MVTTSTTKIEKPITHSKLSVVNKHRVNVCLLALRVIAHFTSNISKFTRLMSNNLLLHKQY